MFSGFLNVRYIRCAKLHKNNSEKVDKIAY